MTLDIQFKLKRDPNYIKYIRENSYWYKLLTRNPLLFDDFVEEVKTKYRLRPVDKIAHAINTIEMIENVMSTLK